jgi:hypothetical protein
VDRHLITIEVSVERLTNERVELYCLTFDQDGLECLDTKPVKRWRTVQQHGVLLDNVAKYIPDLGTPSFHHPLRCLDVLGEVQINESFHHEWLEEFEGHDLWQATLVQTQLRANNDDRASRVVHSLSEKVLAEPPLLSLQHVRQRLERTVPRARYGTAATPVVEQRVNRLLEHPLLVVDDDFWRTEVDETLQPIVAINHSAVEVVHVRGGKPATIELDHGTKIRRDHRHSFKDHSGGIVLPISEWLNDLEALLCPLPTLLAPRIDEILA